ncbi:ribose ABC transporter permease [Moorella sp. E308F]|uniref:ABC transporter permease n=1 Tax=Moorella sp. E308F TaxID=2572682 RepID=UPI0010FFC327|nr:ribose ABC transporter permease [Moorella sp. E308F]GEA14970.1 ribose ABC transporter permease [Moorella sp. E308F]
MAQINTDGLPKQKSLAKWLKAREIGLTIILIILSMIFSIISDNFFTFSNLINVARQVSVNAISAVGMTYVILTAEIDLSVGSLLAMSGIAAASVFNKAESFFFALIVALLLSTIVGFLNGFITAKGKISGFITTLAMMSIIRGLGFIYTGGYPISAQSEKFTSIGTGYWGPFPVPVVIMIIIMIAGHLVLNKTSFGRYVYAVGGNETAAKWSGINVTNIRIAVFTISGFLTGLSGIILAGRLASGQPVAGQGFELDVIASVIVGGTSLMGGKGTIIGTFIGALLIGILSNGLTLLNVNPFFQMVVKGLVIIGAVLLDTLSRKRLYA